MYCVAWVGSCCAQPIDKHVQVKILLTDREKLMATTPNVAEYILTQQQLNIKRI